MRYHAHHVCTGKVVGATEKEASALINKVYFQAAVSEISYRE